MPSASWGKFKATRDQNDEVQRAKKRKKRKRKKKRREERRGRRGRGREDKGIKTKANRSYWRVDPKGRAQFHDGEKELDAEFSS